MEAFMPVERALLGCLAWMPCLGAVPLSAFLGFLGPLLSFHGFRLSFLGFLGSGLSWWPADFSSRLGFLAFLGLPAVFSRFSLQFSWFSWFRALLEAS